MLIEKEFKKLIHELVKENLATITLGGSTITVHVFDHDTKISLSTPVYYGGNFIPKSVRACISRRAPFDKDTLKTYLTVDEDNFRISLNFLGGLSQLNKQMFIDLIEDFGTLADNWRIYLDDNDKRDLIYVRTKL